MTFLKFPNIFLILVGGGILYVKWTMRQTTFGEGHKKIDVLSFHLTKATFITPLKSSLNQNYLWWGELFC
jgi:hypothetical protein